MLNEIVYLNPSRQHSNYGVNGYGTEADNMMVVAKRVKAILVSPGVFKDVHVTEGLTLSQAIADSNAKGATIHLDIHSDADGDLNNNTGRGCTGLYKSDKGKQLVSCIYKHVSALTPTVDRGLSYRTDLGCLNQTHAVAGLIECFFHDNSNDVAFYNANVDAIAHAIANGILEYVGVVKVVDKVVASAPAVKNNVMEGIVTSTALNVRTGPSTNNSIIGKLKRDDKVKIGFRKGKWYNIFYGDKGGFVSSDYVKVEPVTRTVKATSLNVRKGESTYYTAIGSLTKGQLVKVGFFTQNGWANIFYGDEGGYVSGDYLE